MNSDSINEWRAGCKFDWFCCSCLIEAVFICSKHLVICTWYTLAKIITYSYGGTHISCPGSLHLVLQVVVTCSPYFFFFPRHVGNVSHLDFSCFFFLIHSLFKIVLAVAEKIEKRLHPYRKPFTNSEENTKQLSVDILTTGPCVRLLHLFGQWNCTNSNSRTS